MIFNSKLAYHSSLLTTASALYGVVDCGVWRTRGDDCLGSALLVSKQTAELLPR